MTRRTRTAKGLAQRIDLNYFKRTHPFRRWRLLLSIALPAVALLWIASYAAAGSQAPYTSGPVATAHASFGMKCAVCHRAETSGVGGFRAHVTDQACTTCHDGPAHHANETFTPECASCHLEHRGRVQLAAVRDSFCAQCHSDLKTKDGRTPGVTASVGPFDEGHPEFAAVKSGATDKTALRFNHKVHLKKDLRGATGPVTLECAQCHEEQASGFRVLGSGGSGGSGGSADADVAQAFRPAPGSGVAQAFRPAGVLTYARHCASCHPLFFDPSVDTPAPHDAPDVVRAFVRGSLNTYIAQHPGDVSKPDAGRGRIPENFPIERLGPARTPAEWVDRRAAAAERLLWGKACRECHVVDAAASTAGLPSIRPPQMPTTWMRRAKFEHRTHQLVNCQSCHRAEESTETSDVLMPTISTCQKCHNSGANAAESRCFKCHGYHDWTKAKPVKSRFRLTDLTN